MYIHAPLTHWGRVTHICVSKLPIIGSVNGLSPGRRQAIIWTNAGILLIGPVGTNFNRNSYIFLKKIHLKRSSGKWWTFCLGLNVLKERGTYIFALEWLRTKYKMYSSGKSEQLRCNDLSSTTYMLIHRRYLLHNSLCGAQCLSMWVYKDL